MLHHQEPDHQQLCEESRGFVREEEWLILKVIGFCDLSIYVPGVCPLLKEGFCDTTQETITLQQQCENQEAWSTLR